ncbi:ABC transporter substrate-binding protein [candidate division KSB1 bacterium]|nr:ABC transporter substrate-binding protein [candidate division KSB1 bacterium]
MKKGPIIVIVIILLVFGFLLWQRLGNKVTVTGKDSPIDRPIQVGIVTWGGYAGGIMENNGFDATKDCDFYRDHGIQVKLNVIDDFVQSRSAFKAGGDKGGIDIVWGTVDAYALEYPALKELNPQCIMQYDWSRGGDAIAVDGTRIKEAKDLVGKSISVAEDTPSHYFALFVLEETGLKPRDVQWRFVNSAIDAANVFKAGRVDATVSWSPDVYIAARERPGGKILMSTREATNLIADIFIARGDFIDKHPEAVKRFVTGWLDGVDKVHRDPEPVIKLMAKGFNLAESDSRDMLGDVHLPNHADNMAFFDSFNPVGYDKIFEKASKLWRVLGKINEIAQAKESRNTAFLMDAETAFRGQQRADPVAKGVLPKATGESKDAITKQVTINFPVGSASLDYNAQTVVRNEVAQFVSTFGGCYVSIEGNTDNTGSYDLNKRLSLERATSVRDFLIEEFRMPAQRFEVKGNAWDKPWDGKPVSVSNATAEGKARNRRTDIVIRSYGG